MSFGIVMKRKLILFYYIVNLNRRVYEKKIDFFAFLACFKHRIGFGSSV